MPYSVDDIKKLRAGYKNKEKESPERDSSSYSVEDISKLRNQYRAMNRPKEIEASTSVKPANNVTAPVTYEATRPETAQPEFRFNSTEEYDKAISDLGMTFGEKVGYKAKGLLNGLLDLTADARLNSPSVTNSPTLSQSAIVTNVPYSEKEREYSALQAEKGRFSAENVFQEFETKYPDYKENMDTKRAVYIPTDARDLFLYTTRMSTDPNYWYALIDNMTDEEVAMGNQIMASEGSEAYWDYMGKMDTYVSKRKYDAKTDAMDKWANNPDNSGLAEFGKKALLTADRTLNNAAGTLGTGVEYAESFIAGADPNPYSGYSGLSNLAQDESEIVTKGMGETGAFIYNTANSIVDSTIGAAMFGKSYSVLMGTNAFNTTYRDLKERGASNEDIITGALLSGAAEAVFEEVSLDRLLTPKNIKSKKLLIKEALLQSGVEASEEVCTEIANIITEEMNQGANSDTAQMIEQMREAGYSEEEIKREIGNNVSKRINMAALGGALSGLVMGAAWGGADFYQNKQIGKGVNRDSFSDVSEKYDDGSDYGVEISELKSKYGDEWSTKASDAEIGSAYRTAINNLAYTLAEETNELYNADEIKSKLAKLSDERADLQTLLDSENSVDSETDEHKEKIAQLEKGIADIDSRYEALQNQLSGASFKRAQNLYTDTLLAQDGVTLKTNNDLNVGTRTSYKGMDDLKIIGVKSDEGKITLVTNKGELDAKSKDVVLSGNMAQIVTIASNMDNQRKANALVANYNGQDVQDYITASQLAWTYGYNKNDELGMEQLAEDLPNLSISQEDVINIYEAGLSAKNAELNEASKANEEIKKKYSGEFKAGTFKADGIDLAKLTSTERVVYFMAQSFSEMGINIELFRDVRATSKNGSYDKNNNVVRINLAARYYTNNGIFDRRYAINTMAHELTHWMEVNSAKEYASLKAMVWKYYASIGVDVEKLIAEEKPEKIGRKAAESEVMARACEDMFNNPATFAQITKDADAKTMGKIKTAIAKAFDKIMDFLSRMMRGYGSNSTAATLIRQNQEVFEQLRKQWTATFEAGLEFNQAYNEAITPADDIDVKNSDKVTMEESVEGVAGKLMAYHNLDESSLMKTIELGGFPMPSIAIKLAEVGHADYGDISVIFFPNTIDPQSNKYNDVFSGDAWTPVFPSVDVKIDSKVLQSIQDKVIKLVGGAETYYKMGGANLDVSNAEDKFNRNRDVSRAYGTEKTLMYAFLKDTGKAFDIPMKEKKLHPDLPNENIGAMAKVIGKEALDDANNNGYQWMKDNKDIVDKIRLMANEASLRNYDAQVANGAKKENAKLREFYATQFDTDGELSFNDFDKLMRAMRQSFGEVEQVVDTAKYEELLDKNVDKDEYNKWLNELFDGIIEKEGIRNNADYFTSSGNRRSWDALHWELTLENVIRAMRQQEKQGSAGFFGGQNIWGVATKKYKSIAEMRKDIARLVHQNEEERDAQRAEFTERLLAITNDIMYKGKGTNPFIEHDHAAEAIVDSLRGPKTVKAIEKSLREWTTLNIKDDTAQKILDLYNEIMVMPTDYFEAKPARAVGFDEIAYVVIPSNSSKELKDALTREGIAYHEYEKSEDNADRIKVTNEAAVDSEQDVLFNLKSIDSNNYDMIHNSALFAGKAGRNREAQLIKIRNDREHNKGLYIPISRGNAIYRVDDALLLTNTSQNPLIKGAYHVQIEAFENEKADSDIRNWSDNVIDIILEMEKGGKLNDVQREYLCSKLCQHYNKMYGRRVGLSFYRRDRGGIRRNIFIAGKAYNVPIGYKVRFDTHDGGIVTDVERNYYSSKVDSAGRTLSLGQADYFQDSKVRDSNGNLLKVYHGTPAKGFTVFRGPLNYYTADRNYAERYTNTSASDTKKTAGEAGVYEGYLNIVNPFDLSDAKTRKIFVDEYIKGGYAQGINPMASKTEIDDILARGIDWVEADNLKDFIDDKEYDYDGIILNEGGDIVDGKSVMRGNSFVTFNSNQFKDIDNLNPTDAEDIYYSEKVTDKKTLNFLNKQIANGEYITTYKSMRLDDGKLHFPMAALINGQYENEYELGQWYQAVEHPENIQVKVGKSKFVSAVEHPELINEDGSNLYFNLDKGKSTVTGNKLGNVPARYNPYEHSSNVVLNDQFTSAYKRPELVTVEMRVPMSELTSGYRAQFAKDPVGWTDWKTGPLATDLKANGVKRDLFLSRYAMPVRILSDQEVAQKYKELIGDSGIAVPDNVVTPGLLQELKKLNISIKESGLLSEKVDYIDKPSGKLGFTNERIDKLLSGGYYGSTNPNYAQAYIAYMSPEDFLKLTTGKNQRALERVKKWGSDEPFDLDKMAEQFNYVPLQLNIDEENNEVIGHEGRHRMAQLSQMGYKQVPVLLFNYDNKYSKQSITSIDLMPQWFQELDDSLNDSDRVTVKDLIPFSQGNADIIKERFGEGQKDATLFSDKIDDDIMGMFDFDMNGFEKTMKADVKRLTESMVKSVSEGQNMTDKQLNLIARTLLKESGSTYGIKALTADLRDVYEYILDNVWAGQLDWEVMMAKAYDTAQKIMNEVKATNIDDYYKGILDDIRKSRVQLNDTQIQEAKSILGGGNYRNLFMGKVILAKDGVMLDQKWQSWAGKYPGVFSADISPNDQVRELLDVYDTVRDLSTNVQTFNDTQSVMAMAEEIYQKFWNVYVVSKKEMDDTVKKLNADHKKAMDKLKASRDEAIKNVKTADAMYYGRKLNELRNRKDKELQDYKDYKKKKAEERKELVQRRATINDITDTAKTLMSWLKENGTKHRVPDVLKGSVLNLLDAIDFSSRRLLGLVGGKDTFVPTKKDISMGKAMENVRDIVRKAMKAQTDGEASDEFLGYIDFPHQFDEDLNDITNHINDIERRTKDSAYVLEEMSLDDLLSLKEALKIMKHSVSKMNSIISSTNAHSCDYYSQDTIKTAKEFGEKKNGGNVVVNVVGNFFNFNNALPVYVFKRFGKGAQEIFRLLQNGWDKFAFNINTIKEFADKAYTDEEVNQWTKEVHEVTVLEVPTDAEREQGKENSERDIKLTTAQIMSLYCLSKREQARGHILGGGIRIADFKDNWSTIVQSKAVTLTESELERIIGMLTARQREVADTLQTFMNTTCSDWGNEVTMKRFGIRAFTEENYFPIKSDSNVLRADVRDDAQSIYALLNMSFTKSLVKKANNQIVVDDIFNVFTVHTSDMAKYNSIALPVLDTIKWWNYKEKEERGGQQFTTNSVKSELETAYGKGANKYVRNLLSDLNGNAESGRYDGPIRRFTKRYKVAAVGANLSVALLQPISFFRATYAIDEKYLAKALTKKPSIEKCKKYCGVALWKSLGFYDTNINRGLDSIIKHSNTIKDKATDYSLRLAELGDSITWGYLWNACEAEIMDTRNLKYGSEEFNEAVALRLRDILYETQVFDSTMSRSDIMRAKGAAQDLTAFMSEPTVTTNMMYDAGVNFQREASRKGLHSAMQNYGKSVAKASEAYLITALLEAIVRGILDKLRDTDDDSIVELFVKEFKDALNPLSKIPVVKEIVSMFQGYDPTRMDLAGFYSAVNTAKAYLKILSGDKEWSYKTTYQTMQAIGQLTGLPLSNAMREIATLWNNTIGKMYPSLTLKK